MTANAFRRALDQVLVPVDLSPFSAHVLDRVAHLPYTSGATVSLLHVVPTSLGRSVTDEGGSLVSTGRKLDELAAELSLRLPAGVRVVGTTVAGTPFQVIAARARELSAELVVIGRHGQRSFADALVGSTAERIVRTCETPVLVVNEVSTRPYRRALVAVDLSSTSRAALEAALRLLDAHSAEARVVHADDGRAWDVTSTVLEFLAPYESVGVGFSVADRRGDPRAVILAEMKSARPDLLVLGTHGHGTIVQHLLGSVAEAVLRNASCDMLVARAR
jgi:nucleotide-binding universal stress UspA family protein